jgi:tyrosinase
MAKAKTTESKGSDKRMKEPKHNPDQDLIERPTRMRIGANMTFAEMLRDDPKVRRILKLPPWLKFLLPYQRRDQAKLSAIDQQRFLCALNVLIANGTYGQLVDVHEEMHMQHTNDRLLPWHRIFLLQLEQAMQAIHPDVSIPYWDWTQSSEQSIPAWLVGVLPTVVTPTRTIAVVRSPGANGDLATIASNVPSIMASTSFGAFAPPVNGVHGAVHIWVGGSMSDPSTAAADPIFWMHHANLDRLWWQWYNSPQGNHQNPALAGGDAVMDPWPYNEADIRSISSLGYAYV